MDATGSAYLYALAAVSVTFVGFAALLLSFRQARGEPMTRYEGYFLLSFVQSGFVVTGGALLPLVLALCGLSAPMVWRVSGGIMAIPILAFVATLPGRRRAATSAPTPRYVRVLALALPTTIALYLASNAIGASTPAGVGPYAAAMTGLFFSVVIAYIIALNAALAEPPKTSR